MAINILETCIAHAIIKGSPSFFIIDTWCLEFEIISFNLPNYLLNANLRYKYFAVGMHFLKIQYSFGNSIFTRFVVIDLGSYEQIVVFVFAITRKAVPKLT